MERSRRKSSPTPSPSTSSTPQSRRLGPSERTRGDAMTFEVKVPDIGDFNDVPVIEVFVKAGDVVKAEDPLATLESDKATMDVPSPRAGTIKEVRVKVGDKVSEGSSLVVMDDGAAASAAAPA